jgi:hypothetical protein
MRTGLSIALVALFALSGAADARSAAHEGDDLVPHLASSKHTLVDGIRHAEKLGGAAISAKFEVEHGKFWLSVYSARRGLKPDAEHNSLVEYKAEAALETWDPPVEVFQDVAHVARSATQLTLLQVNGSSLENAIKQASAIQKGTVYSAIPTLTDGRPSVRVSLATPEGKSVAVEVDLRTGKAEKR